ncbi:MAG: hypothetical protein AABZ64_09715 [Nitrospinota bacterium]
MTGKVFELAIKRAGTLEREKVRDALAGLEFKGILPGKFKVDKTGLQVGHEWVVLQWQNGKKELIWPSDVATKKLQYPFTPWDKR